MLFLLGGLVRSTGSGMGCPDWPKCFGEYIPPTTAEELPENYEDYFKTQRIEKTERFAKLLRLLGFNNKAEKLLADKQIHETHQFNAVKAYVEYINRLWGALAGLIVFATFIASFKFIKTNPTIFVLTTLGFVAVFVNALLGAVVVNTNLIGGLVTAHFLAAFAAIAFFMLARRYFINQPAVKAANTYKLLSWGVLLLLLIQTIAGTQVRESFDTLALSSPLSEHQITALGTSFIWHRILAFITLILAVYLWWKNRKSNAVEARYPFAVVVGIGLQIVLGSLLILTHLESFSKLFHISIAASVFLLEFYICTRFLKPLKN
jgi:cytochrome c oxidase assembly protein subunit 15